MDEENEDLDVSDMSMVSSSTTSIFSKKSSSEKVNLDLNNRKNIKLREKIKNKPMELCMNNINEKVYEAKNKFISLINSYYNALTHINKKIKEKEKIHNSLVDLTNTLLKTILPNLGNYEQLAIHYEKKIKKSKTEDEVIFYLNKLINDIINKLKETSNIQKEEIERLHKRVEFFTEQYENMKKTQEIVSKEERSLHEKQIKKKDEELQKMKLKMSEKEQDIDEGKRKNIDLSDELLEMKEKYNIQAKDIEIIDKKAKEQINKRAINALSTAKYAIKDFLGKVRQFADDLYNYSEMKPSG